MYTAFRKDISNLLHKIRQKQKREKETENRITSGSAEYTGGQTLVLQQSLEEENGQSLEGKREREHINITLPLSNKQLVTHRVTSSRTLFNLQPSLTTTWVMRLHTTARWKMPSLLQTDNECCSILTYHKTCDHSHDTCLLVHCL